MLLFPLIYISSFILSIKEMFRKNKLGVLIFIIIGLPIYTTSISILFRSGFQHYVGIFQLLKELSIIISLACSIWYIRKKIVLNQIDYLVISYLLYTALYVILPIGSNGFINRVLAFKSNSFFVLIYFAGKFINPSELFVKKYYTYILLVIIAASFFILGEAFTSTHFQSYTGYSDFNYYYFNAEPSGNYGLTWTFETASGQKRYSGFFSTPLELAASTIVALAIAAALTTSDDYKIRFGWFESIALLATLICIVLSLSRAALISYFLIIYAYSQINRKVYIIKTINSILLIFIAYFAFLISNTDLKEFFVNTINFTDTSSLGHLLAWVEGIESIISNPMGIGLGESGRLANSINQSIGGENQFIIIGVQLGLIGLFIYAAIYVAMIIQAWRWYYKLIGNEKKICLTVVLIKIGLIVPMLTSEVESFIYVAYLNWFLSGILVNIIATREYYQRELHN